ncbi:hypothetical protein HJP15_02855 [Pseudoalteromonas sp. NEC-BIFX-2020_002]|uniref:hypothetical protein n=1 Tax=Pseudoalteromonas sp. NEC-BIFX-2020_002 TaxID=2732353 RepID=UPI0014776818|nr:hypothetical protein [Pseudoalteromonas sp. NEC-BIFX-2020_002]NNG41890.1 hypothetical protein [Pseudoalteromonas sp. NEC-BIFX-2020_002]
MGDKVINTLVALLNKNGFEVGAFGGVIEVEKSNAEEVKQFLSMLNAKPLPSESDLAASVVEKNIEKFDEFLPNDLLNIGYGSRAFDIADTKSWLTNQC